MAVKRKRATVTRTLSPTMIKSLRKQVSQWKLKANQFKLKLARVNKQFKLLQTKYKKLKLIETKFNQIKRQLTLTEARSYKKGYNDAMKAFKKFQAAEIKLLKKFEKECQTKLQPKASKKRKVAKTARKASARTTTRKAVVRKAKPRSRARSVHARRSVRGNASYRIQH